MPEQALSGCSSPDGSSSKGRNLTERTGTPRGAGGPLDVEYLSSLLKQGGKLDRAVPSFEYRPAQVQMLEAVAYSFNNAEKLIVEAGTGTGKSIAYLIPSFYFSLSTGRPVVISTNTINLQEQLLGKDIPDLAAALQLPADFRAVTLKGRSNYLCLRRFQINRDAIAREEGGTELVPRLNGWLSTTNSGDVSELGLMGKQGVLWTRICAREGECLAEKCRFHEQGLCFLMAARAKARNASIVITNHALLIADLVSGGQLLPDYKHLIIDEGHHLEDVATDQFGWSVSQNGIAELVKEIEQEMVSLNRFQRSGRVPSQRKHDLAGLVDECRRCSRDLALRSEAFFKAVSEPAIDAG